MCDCRQSGNCVGTEAPYGAVPYAEKAMLDPYECTGASYDGSPSRLRSGGATEAVKGLPAGAVAGSGVRDRSGFGATESAFGKAASVG